MRHDRRHGRRRRDPHAQRAWGCEVLGPTTVRIVLDDSDPVLRQHVDGGGRIAVTSADVRTLQSVQLKGWVRSTEDEPTEGDVARCEEHIDELVGDIEATDHFPRELTERMVPPGSFVAVVEVEELFDQTPGPSAGSRVEAGS